MIRSKTPDIGHLFSSRAEIERALRLAARDAAIDHKRLGLPLVIMRDGIMVLVPPDEIVIDDEPEEQAQRTS